MPCTSAAKCARSWQLRFFPGHFVPRTRSRQNGLKFDTCSKFHKDSEAAVRFRVGFKYSSATDSG